jgi:hypothetical protein
MRSETFITSSKLKEINTQPSGNSLCYKTCDVLYRAYIQTSCGLNRTEARFLAISLALWPFAGFADRRGDCIQPCRWYIVLFNQFIGKLSYGKLFLKADSLE